VLVREAGDQEAALATRLERAFHAVETADVAMVSDMHAGFEVSGAGAEDVLRQGAPLDLSVKVFPPGTIAGTELWAVTAIIDRLAGDEPSFRLLVDMSLAGYIADWLATAAGSTSPNRPGTMQRPPASLRP
jgi:heterotetrameric sarcosine oxidase gamma subunit